MTSTTSMIENIHISHEGLAVSDATSHALFQEICERITKESIVKAESQPATNLGDNIVYEAQQPTKETTGSFLGMPLPVAA